MEGIKNLADKKSLLATSITSWDDPKFKIDPKIRRALTEDLGFEQPSKIQALTIPMITSPPYRNLIAQSQNGTGKTLAFILSSLLRVDPKSDAVQVVVLAPFRELARQIHDGYKEVTMHAPEYKICLVLPDIEHHTAKSEGQVVIGTPGSLLKDMMVSPKKYAEVKVFVMDEADKAFDPKEGLSKDIVGIYKKMNPKKQTLLFSATFSEEMIKNVKMLIKEAATIKLPVQQLTLKGVIQLYLRCEPKKKFDEVFNVFQKISCGQTIVFTNTRNFCDACYNYFEKRKFSVSVIRGGMQPAERDAAIKNFKEKKSTILITTGLLSRGYDNRAVTLVVNLDIPKQLGSRTEPNTEEYLHRVGRTGRFGDIGIALNLVETEEDHAALKKVEEFYKCEIKETNISVLEKQLKEVVKIRKEQQDKEDEEEAAAEAKKKAK